MGKEVERLAIPLDRFSKTGKSSNFSPSNAAASRFRGSVVKLGNKSKNALLLKLKISSGSFFAAMAEASSSFNDTQLFTSSKVSKQLFFHVSKSISNFLEPKFFTCRTST